LNFSASIATVTFHSVGEYCSNRSLNLGWICW
jgi:hypothetical protein